MRHSLIPALSRAAGVLLLATSVGAFAQAPGPAVKIGVLGDHTGLYSDISGMGGVDATRMAVEDFKASAAGRKANLQIDVVSADSQNKPDVAATLARKWYDVDGVDVIVDNPTSAIALAVAQIAVDKNRVAIVTGAGSSDLTGKSCTPNSMHWTWDTWSVSHGTATAITQRGGKTWFFLTADYTFGHALERDATEIIKANGGTVVGSVRHPLDTKDFSSFMLQAQSSKAKIIGLANGGGDTINSIKTAAEFGIVQGGQSLAGMVVFLSDVHSLGLKAAQGLLLTTGFYWDLDDKTRAFGERFAKRNGGRYPTMVHAGTYSATMAYLNAVAGGASPKDGAAVVKAMKAVGTWDDPLFGPSTVRADGRMAHRMMLVEVKKPDESKKPYDYYKIATMIPAEQAFRPLKDGNCPLVK